MVTLVKRAGCLLATLTLCLALPIQAQEAGSAGTPDPSGTAQDSASPESKVQKTGAQAPAGPPATIKVPPDSPTPPTNLKKVGNHWTPYQPPDPESFPEGAKVHIIVKGDTLWDLANTHFQNPYLWPQIWNENQYILDSHWIYPGDPVLLPPRPTVVSEIVPAEGQTGNPAPPAPEAPSSEEAPAGEEPEASTEMTQQAPAEATPSGSLAADHTDIYCSGEIKADHHRTALYIANGEEQGKIGLTAGDLVYISGGRDGDKVQAGEVLLISTRQEEVFHPLTDKWLGTYVKRMGRVKVLAVQERTAIGEIIEACGDRILVGFELEPDREIPVPDYREMALSKLDVEPSGKSNGYVVHLQDNMSRAYAGKLVDVDLGSRDGLKPGDLLLAYVASGPPVKRGATFNYKWGNRRYESEHLRSDGDNLPFPRKPIAQLIVLTTEEKTSTAKVLNSLREIEVGSRVEVR
ncbi:MAG TPA: LysM peptidoglycan-binding domain-containing protein [Candidatus Polarisedimenticolia bacterium]|nr:LysM peptidoglycan-binding domain-containing protein [Candidatus Polarisedimenticolia bacterium]